MKMARNGWKLLKSLLTAEMEENCGNWLEMAGNGWNG